MKLFLMMGLIAAGTVYGEMHAFTLPDGRTLEAEVVDFNGRLGTVVLKRADGKRIPIKPEVFIEADQQYIREWSKTLAFRSENVLKISCADDVVKDWKKEETQDIRYTDGSVEKDFIVNIKKYEQIAFNFEFNNLGDAPLKGISMEYCIYYEQSNMAMDKKPETVQKVFQGKETVPEIPVKKKVSMTTKPVEIYEDNLNNIPQGGDGDVRRPGKGDVHGMRARLYMTTSSGEKVMREVSSPSTLSEKNYPWKE
jgi:hypothetical protein